MLPQIGLYYPYIHFRDEGWLKTAALYWPKLARIVPHNYKLSDLRTTRVLTDELDFVVPVDPRWTAQAVAPMFMEALHHHANSLRARFEIPWSAEGNWSQAEALAHIVEIRDDPSPPPPRPLQTTHANPSSGAWPGQDGGLAGIHWDEINSELLRALLELRIGARVWRTQFAEHREHNTAPWIAMHSALAWVYKCAFVEELAAQSGFIPTTDQPESHLAADGWNADRIAEILLGMGSRPSERFASSDDLANAVGLLAIRIAVPDNLTDVPVEKIVKLRRRYRAEFDNFTSTVSDTVTKLQAEMADVTLPEARGRYVRMEVERRFELPMQELTAAMKGLGIDTAYSAANLKFELPTSVAAVGSAALVGQPVLGTALGAAFAIVGLSRTRAEQRKAFRSGSPVAYLLSVERGLQPPSLLQRIVRSA
ncbi:DUF6236 family protein [Streptomyces sp. NPDC051985]|uniref:DUF6236 family protein n=1 Tax=Streptomyces sp. NPDC051985 TaxID=3155807 RepID=UPI0034124C6B